MQINLHNLLSLYSPSSDANQDAEIDISQQPEMALEIMS